MSEQEIDLPVWIVEANARHSRIAQLLYEHGDMLADRDGGGIGPDWEDLVMSDDTEDKLVVFEHHDKARNILELDDAAANELGRLLLDHIADLKQREIDRLRASLERAKGLEPGSLRGWAGVQQRVVL